MIFYSHSKKKASGAREGTKVLIKHIQGVKDNALCSLYDAQKLPYDTPTLREFVAQLCDLHDLGKYTHYFQEYLLGANSGDDQTLKRHSQVGACTIFNKYLLEDERLAAIGYFLIEKHHGNLDYLVDSFTGKDEYDEDKFLKRKASIEKSINAICNDLNDENLLDFINWPDWKKGKRQAKELGIKKKNIRNYFLTNYAFSLLIEGDKLDASDTCLHTRQPIPTNVVDDYIKKIIFEKNIDLSNPQNKLRAEVRQIVTEHLKHENILENRLFTLTAPTGIGKTLTSLDFAIKLKALIRKEEERDAQIICALPFINIIEQTLSEYQNVLPTDINLLAHYQFADIFEQDRAKSIHPDDTKAYQEKLMQLDTWQSDVIITSFVQLLHTLIGYRNKILKKFNHFAGSIIIMDEVQNISLELVPLVGASLYYLAELLDARIILMTATEPLIFPLANKEILNERGVTAKAFQLLPNAKSIFQEFTRTKIVPIQLDEEIIDTEQFTSIFRDKWETEKSCLIVCNTVNRSIEVYQKIKEEIEGSELSARHPIYYLSTNIIPFHRLHIIEQIKKDLKSKGNKLKPILVATQCVEAGVDLDFDIGFRDIAPIDSIVQVAGRVNRNNDEKRKYSPVYIMNFGDCDKVYGSHSSAQVIQALSTKKGFIGEEDYYDLVGKYFNAKSESYENSRSIFNAMEILKYDGTQDERDNYETVSSFQVIKQNNRLTSVFIATDSNINLNKHYSAKQVLEAFDKLINKEIPKTEFNKKYKRDFQQRMVNVPKYYLEHLVEDHFNLTENIKMIPSQFVEEYYLETGFKREKEEVPHYLSF